MSISSSFKYPIKMAFIQTLPGIELVVGRELYKACKSIGISNYRLIKTLGGFDQVLIYQSNNFGFNLTRYGSIPGILKFNQFLCYPSIGVNLQDIFEKTKKFNFLGIVLLKLGLQAQKECYFKENDFVKTLNTYGISQDNCVILRTMGWNEFILILLQKEFKDIIKQMILLNYEELKIPNCSNNQLVFKTSSYIGLNYSELYGKDWDKDNSQVNLQTSGRTSQEIGLDSIIESEVLPSLLISAKSSNLEFIKNHWESEGYVANDVVGDYDIRVERINNDITWRNLVADILYFRYTFRDLINSTCTNITLTKPLKSINNKKDEKSRSQRGLEFKHPPDFLERIKNAQGFINIEYNSIEEIFGEQVAPILASQFSSLSALAQHPITGRAYWDMLRFPEFIMDSGAELGDNKREKEYIALTCAEALCIGAELRSYGTHGQVEKRFGRYSKLKGGVHQALLALEYFPSHIIDQFTDDNTAWRGYINAWDHGFFSMNEVIFVPTECLWNYELIWIVLHEIAHNLTYREKNLLNEDRDEIKAFLADKRDRKGGLKFIGEIVADLISYIIGFFGDFELFLKVFWKYYKKNQPSSLSHDDIIGPHLTRTFFVNLWDILYKKNWDRPDDDPVYTDIFSEEKLFKMFLKNISSIEEIINFDFKRKHFIAAKTVHFLMEIRPLILYINKLLSSKLKDRHGNKLDIRSKTSWLENSNVLEAFNSFKQGKTFYAQIDYPQAIMYLIFKHLNEEKSISEEYKFNFCMSALNSFANLQLKKVQNNLGQ
ncbi:MAG: hypothetical protein KAR54_03695 [Candidatus Pacebacteria bacterium]|nr:hypothetical protein [Candidatus Paceibacterota bacterium]